MLNYGVPVSNTVFSTNSAGDDLTIILLQCSEKHPGILPTYMTVQLYSPWIDLD